MSTNNCSKMRKDSGESVSSKNTEFVYEEDTWKVIKAYLKEKWIDLTSARFIQLFRRSSHAKNHKTI